MLLVTPTVSNPLDSNSRKLDRTSGRVRSFGRGIPQNESTQTHEGTSVNGPPVFATSSNLPTDYVTDCPGGNVTSAHQTIRPSTYWIARPPDRYQDNLKPYKPTTSTHYTWDCRRGLVAVRPDTPKIPYARTMPTPYWANYGQKDFS